MRERRAVEVDQGVRQHLERGGGVEFLTMTVQHHRGDRLAGRLDAVAQSLGLTLRGSGWERRRDRLGYVGSIRAVEVTYGENGWHPHSHSLLFFDRPLTEGERADLRSWIHGRWSKVVADRGFGEVHQVHGVDLRPVSAGDGSIGGYVTKVEGGWTAGHELARSDRKNSSPVGLLVEFVATGEKRLADLWAEYEAATYGRRSLQWSNGLRGLLLGVEEETADEDLAASEGIDLTLFRAMVAAADWHRVLKAGATGDLLTSVEEGAALLLFLMRTFGGDPQPIDAPRPEAAGASGASPGATGPVRQPSGGAGVSPAGAEPPA